MVKTRRPVWSGSEPDYVFDVWDRSVARCATKPLAGAKAGERRASRKSRRWSILISTIFPFPIPFPQEYPLRYLLDRHSPSQDDIVAWQQSFFSGQAVSLTRSPAQALVVCVLGEAPQ